MLIKESNRQQYSWLRWAGRCKQGGANDFQKVEEGIKIGDVSVLEAIQFQKIGVIKKKSERSMLSHSAKLRNRAAGVDRSCRLAVCR